MTQETRPKILIKKEDIVAIIDRLAELITRDYAGKDPVIICILKGSFIFTADLIRQLSFPLQVEFIRISSYGKDTESSGNINLVHGLNVSIKGRDVLVIEDVVDTGRTVAYLLSYLRGMQPLSLKLCTLTDKPSRRQVPITIDYLGCTIPNKFVVGYGIDWDEKFRNLPDLCYIDEKIPS